MLLLHDLQLGYQDLPKNASTTIFAWLFECIYGHSFYDEARRAERGPLDLHEFFFRGRCRNSERIDNTTFATEAPQNLFTFAVTRDPIKRFLSMYSNRVQHRGELSENSGAAAHLREAGLQANPDANMLAECLEQYLACDKGIYHHSRPMCDFLGEDLSIYTHLADVSELAELIEKIKKHWRQHGLNALADTAPSPQFLQTGGQKLGLQELNPTAFEHLLEYYAADYERIPTVDRRQIEHDYTKARAAAKATPVPVNTSADRTELLTRLTRNDRDCPVVDVLWVDDIPTTIPAGEPLKLSGALLLHPAVDRSGWKLIAMDERGAHKVPWHFKSLNMAKHHPDNPNAATARFRIRGLNPSNSQPIQLFLQSPEKGRWPLLSINTSSQVSEQ